MIEWRIEHLTLSVLFIRLPHDRPLTHKSTRDALSRFGQTLVNIQMAAFDIARNVLAAHQPPYITARVAIFGQLFRHISAEMFCWPTLNYFNDWLTDNMSLSCSHLPRVNQLFPGKKPESPWCCWTDAISAHSEMSQAEISRPCFAWYRFIQNIRCSIKFNSGCTKCEANVEKKSADGNVAKKCLAL